MAPHLSQLGGVELAGLQEDPVRDPELPHVVEEGPGPDLPHHALRELQALREQVREEGDAVGVIEQRRVLFPEAFRHARQIHGSCRALQGFEGGEGEIELAGDAFHGTSGFVLRMSKLRADAVSHPLRPPKSFELLEESPVSREATGSFEASLVYAQVRFPARQRTDSVSVGDAATRAG